jgi:hypothetical protein
MVVTMMEYLVLQGPVAAEVVVQSVLLQQVLLVVLVGLVIHVIFVMVQM